MVAHKGENYCTSGALHQTRLAVTGAQCPNYWASQSSQPVEYKTIFMLISNQFKGGT